MAQGRILKKTITTSERINKLSDKFALLYTWLIPFQDDFGLIWYSADKIKWIIVPNRKSLDKKEIEEFLNKIIDLKLIQIVKIEKKQWIWFPDFPQKQTLKKDRTPNTYLDNEYNWAFVDKIATFVVNKDNNIPLENNGFQMEDNGFQVEKQVKLSEVKLSKAIWSFFWKEYPRKVNKSIAFKSWEKLNPDNELLKIILKDLNCRENTEEWKIKTFIPHPSTYINNKRWEDEDKGTPIIKKPYYDGNPVFGEINNRTVKIGGEFKKFAGREEDLKWK